MKSSIVAVVLALLLCGCATKIYRAVPPPKNPNEAAEVLIVRNTAFTGGGVGIGIQIDGYKVASLSIGHFLRAKLDAGQHAIGTMAGSITLTLEANKTYYFLTGLGISGDPNIERLDESAARKWLAKSEEVLLQ